MKTLQLKKYLLIEPENPIYLTVSESGIFYADPETEKSQLIEGKFKYVCMGDDFEQDQKQTKAEGCILGQMFCKLGFDAFVREIEEAGFYWGKNPLQSTRPTNDLSFYDSKKEREICIEKWKEAESRTFNPEKTRIYEIL